MKKNITLLAALASLIVLAFLGTGCGSVHMGGFFNFPPRPDFVVINNMTPQHGGSAEVFCNGLPVGARSGKDGKGKPVFAPMVVPIGGIMDGYVYDLNLSYRAVFSFRVNIPLDFRNVHAMHGLHTFTVTVGTYTQYDYHEPPVITIELTDSGAFVH